jgi:uncharacterized membrane protein YedE/YeeE
MHPFVQSVLGGTLIGLASWLLLASLGRVAGISGIAAGALFPVKPPQGDTGWRWAFLLGLIVGGAVIAGLLHPPVTAMRPYGLLVIAGLLVGFGTVLGSGCTSGHGVCGIGRRSARSLLATLTFMASGALTVYLITLVRLYGA